MIIAKQITTKNSIPGPFDNAIKINRKKGVNLKLGNGTLYSHLSLDRRQPGSVWNEGMKALMKEILAIKMELCRLCQDRAKEGGYLSEVEKYITLITTHIQ